MGGLTIIDILNRIATGYISDGTYLTSCGPDKSNDLFID